MLSTVVYTAHMALVAEPRFADENVPPPKTIVVVDVGATGVQPIGIQFSVPGTVHTPLIGIPVAQDTATSHSPDLPHWTVQALPLTYIVPNVQYCIVVVEVVVEVVEVVGAVVGADARQVLEELQTPLK